MENAELKIERVPIASRDVFRSMVDDYWHDLMPDAEVCKSQEAFDAVFKETFTWTGGDRHPYWVLLGGDPMGFVSFRLEGENRLDGKMAYVHDFYVASKYRRRGYGAKMVKWLFQLFDRLGVNRLDLNVRLDNSNALAFWEAQGFGIAGYHMRMYRDPKTGTAYKWVLSSGFVDEE